MGSQGDVMIWPRDLSWNFLHKVGLLSATFKQAIKLTFGRNRFSKRTVPNLQTRIHF